MSDTTNSKARLPIALLAIGLLGLSACARAPQRSETEPGTVVSASATSSAGPATSNSQEAAAAESDLVAQLLAGELALQENDSAAALRHYLRAAQLSEDPAVAAQATGLALLDKNWDSARSAIKRWRELGGEGPRLIQAEASLALGAGDADGAFAALLQIVSGPDEAWRLAAQALIQAPDKKLAGAVLERLAGSEKLASAAPLALGFSQVAFKVERKDLAVRLVEAALARTETAEAYAWQAQLFLDKGDRAAARRAFEQGMRLEGKDSKLRIPFAALLSEMGEHAAAARALAEGAQNDYTYAARAAYAARSEDDSLVAALYEELRKLPGEADSDRLHLLGQLAEILERNTEASGWYKAVPEGAGQFSDAQIRLAVLLDAEDQTDAALLLLHQRQTIAGADPADLIDAFLLEAEILLRRERRSDAMGAYDRGLKVIPDSTRLLYARALLHEALDQVAEAERDLRRVVELQPDNADALNALGYTLADRTQRFAEALQLIEKALALKPDEAAIIDSYGWVQYRLGRLPEALKQLQRAYDLNPDAEIAAHLGEVLWVNGDKAGARKVWDQGRAKDAKNAALLETIERLSK